MGISELQSQLFQLLDSRLATYKTPYQARIYKMVIKSLEMCAVINQAEINVLFVKTKRFLSKESVKKEKGRIKEAIKGDFITGGDRRDGQLVQDSSDNHTEGEAHDSDFEDVSSDEEEEKKARPVANKRNAPEDPNNRVYLEHYRETVELE